MGVRVLVARDSGPRDRRRKNISPLGEPNGLTGIEKSCPQRSFSCCIRVSRAEHDTDRGNPSSLEFRAPGRPGASRLGPKRAEPAEEISGFDATRGGDRSRGAGPHPAPSPPQGVVKSRPIPSTESRLQEFALPTFRFGPRLRSRVRRPGRERAPRPFPRRAHPRLRREPAVRMDPRPRGIDPLRRARSRASSRKQDVCRIRPALAAGSAPRDGRHSGPLASTAQSRTSNPRARKRHGEPKRRDFPHQDPHASQRIRGQAQTYRTMRSGIQRGSREPARRCQRVARSRCEPHTPRARIRWCR